MLKAFRGLILATAAVSLPLLAQADCPPEESIDRYAQTAGDALSALHELVPESQLQALEDRYAAMLMLKWQWQGRDAIRADSRAMTQILRCYEAGKCGINRYSQITTQVVEKMTAAETNPLLLESLLPQFPSPNAVTWAKATLECGVRRPQPVLTVDSEPQIETAAIDTSENRVPTVEQAPEPIATNTTTVAVQQPSLGVEQPAQAERFTAPTNYQPQTPIVATAQESNPAVIEVTAQLPAETEEYTPTVEYTVPTGNVDALMVEATNLVSAGKPQDAVVPLEKACFIEAASTEKSKACETLFSVFTNALVSSELSTSTEYYLDLSGRLCDNGYSRGCDNLSRYHSAQNSAEAHRAAVAYAERSCDLANAEACATVSGFYLSGRASQPDPIAAREKLEQSCQLGRLLSCQEVADFYLRGVGGDADNAAALTMVEASCPETGAERADLCVSAADYILINETAGADRSALVRTFIRRACNIGHDVGCAWYAEDLELGIGGAVDLRAARQARLTACEYGDQESCNSRS